MLGANAAPVEIAAASVMVERASFILTVDVFLMMYLWYQQHLSVV